MIKKTLYIILCMCFLLSVNVMANEPFNNTDMQFPAMGEGMPPRGEMQGNMPPRGEGMPYIEMPSDKNGQQTVRVENAEQRGNFPVEEKPVTENTSVQTEESSVTDGEQQVETEQNGKNPFSENNGFPQGGMNFGNMQPQGTQEQQPTGFLGFLKYYSTPVISVVLLVLAYLFVLLYKRKRY